MADRKIEWKTGTPFTKLYYDDTIEIAEVYRNGLSHKYEVSVLGCELPQEFDTLEMAKNEAEKKLATWCADIRSQIIITI